MTRFQQVQILNPGILCAEMHPNILEDLKVLNHKICDYQGSGKGIWFYDTMRPEYDNQADMPLPKEYIDFLYELSTDYTRFFHYPDREDNVPYIEACWINQVSKNQYKAPHIHVPESPGGYEFLSFCTYVDIPWDTEVEVRYDGTGETLSKNRYTDRVLSRNGKIEFFYNTLTGRQNTHLVQIDQSYEGKTLIWPNTMYHSVYPFYSADTHRVSIAGNIGLKR